MIPVLMLGISHRMTDFGSTLEGEMTSERNWISGSLRSGAWLLVVAGLGAAALAGWRRLGGRDPYAKLTSGPRHVADPSAAIRIEGAKVRHYVDGKLVAQADASEMSVSQDRSTVKMNGIRNGLFNTQQGSVQFAGKTGLLNPGVEAVSVSGGVRVAGKGFDISTSTVTIDGRSGFVRAPSPLKGNILGGMGSAASLEWRPNADFLKLKKGSWQGKLPPDTQVPGSAGIRTWNIDSDEVVRDGALEHYADARAADGEVIVMSPIMDRNRKTEVITAVKQGDRRPTYRSAKADIVADKVVIYRKEGRAEFTGNVVMYVRAKKDWDKPLPTNDVKVDGNQPLVPDVPKGLQKGKEPEAISQAERDRDEELRSGKTIRDYPINMRAEQVTYWYKKGQRHAIAKGGNPTAWQQFADGRWRQMWAPEAHYDAEKDMLDLVGNDKDFQVVHKNSVGDAFKTIALTVSTREDQTEDDEYMKTKKIQALYLDRDNPEDPRGAPDQKKSPPPDKTPPPKTGG